MAPDPTSDVSKGPCKPDFYSGLFQYLNWTPILTADFSVYLTRRSDFDSGLFRLPNSDTLILTTDFYVWYGVHGGCDRSAGDAYSSMTLDPTSDIFRGPYTPILWFVFPVGLMRLITVRYFCRLIQYTDCRSFLHYTMYEISFVSVLYNVWVAVPFFRVLCMSLQLHYLPLQLNIVGES
jgi:hypothetical protein